MVDLCFGLTSLRDFEEFLRLKYGIYPSKSDIFLNSPYRLYPVNLNKIQEIHSTLTGPFCPIFAKIEQSCPLNFLFIFLDFGQVALAAPIRAILKDIRFSNLFSAIRPQRRTNKS